MNGFNAVDIVAVIWLLIGSWRGIRQGLAGALLRLLAVGLAAGAGLLGYARLGESIAGSGRFSNSASDLLSFFLIIVATYVLLRLIGLLLANMVKLEFKGKLEPIGGGLVGGMVSASVITLLLLVAGQWPEPQMKKWFAEESWSGRLVQESLGSFWQRLGQQYPALKFSQRTGSETLDTVKNGTVKTIDQAGDAAQKKFQKANKQGDSPVVEKSK